MSQLTAAQVKEFENTIKENRLLQRLNESEYEKMNWYLKARSIAPEFHSAVQEDMARKSQTVQQVQQGISEAAEKAGVEAKILSFEPAQA